MRDLSLECWDAVSRRFGAGIAASCCLHARISAYPHIRISVMLIFLCSGVLSEPIACCSRQIRADTKAIEMNTTQHMIERYGELMTYEQLAGLLKRSESGLRVTMARRTSSAAQVLDNARIRIGRRVYFRTSQIAEMIENA